MQPQLMIGTMWRAAIVSTVLLCATFCDGATQFTLNFIQSTNKVIVTDFYYMLEYSIVRGREQRGKINIGSKFIIKLQMIGKSNQSRWAQGREDL